MQAVILAAGRGTRMRELTESVPKPMLTVGGKTLLEHKLDVLPQEIDEIVLVVGYLAERIRGHFGERYGTKRIRYADQEQYTAGTADALWRAKDILHGRFLVLMGDDIYSAEDMRRCISVREWALLAQEVEHMHQGGEVILDERGRIVAIEEGDHRGKRGFISTNLFMLDTRLFDHPMVPKSPGSTEVGLPQTILAASQKDGISFEPVKATFWLQITAPEDLQKAEDLLAKRD